MSRFTRFFVKYRHLCNFLAKCRDLRTFSSVPPKQSKLLSVPPLSFYQPWGGANSQNFCKITKPSQRGVWQKTTLFPDFFSAYSPKGFPKGGVGVRHLGKIPKKYRFFWKSPLSFLKCKMADN